MSTAPITPAYYARQLGGRKLDIYRILRAYPIGDSAIEHAVKKLLRCGAGHKTKAQDVAEAIQSLQRWQEMEREDAGDKLIALSAELERRKEEASRV